ncbi:MAG: thiamine pyrophosphate-dependent dehydrogenase E1 component subunit alpha [Chloroflexi bacterium]|nr:thiamine pyrophosphate-dependent dehydrogenase E1 component subunit alpha [Chloroflexota bacterium]
MSSAEPVTRSTAPGHEAVGLSRDDLHAMYYYMQLTRSVEDRVRALYLQGKLLGAVYSSRGQEGTAVASAYALESRDVVAPLIRDLGASFVRGIDAGRIFAQWLGRTGGPTGGRDGNLHFGDLSRGVLAPISMLGASIPLCAGVALAGKQRGEGRVALAYIGDGGSNTGDFHEGLNFAAALRLPLIVILEDNGYAYSTPVSQHVALRSFADRATAYGVPSATVDGNNVLEVYGATRAAAHRARTGGGPTLIVATTFRMRGHAEHDDAFYVPTELVAEWERRDPIRWLLTYMDDHHLIHPDERQGIDNRIAREVEEGLTWAEQSPLPDPSTQTRGVYASE